jgi:hypothetical protein
VKITRCNFSGLAGTSYAIDADTATLPGTFMGDFSQNTYGSSLGMYSGLDTYSKNALVAYSTGLRTDSNGLVYLGGTAQVQQGKMSVSFNGSTSSAIAFKPSVDSSTIFQFCNASAAQVGTVTTTVSATAYNTSSDYRLKNITGPLVNSGTFIDALNPCVGSWKIDGSKFVGFVAHEFSQISPSSVSGEKDAVDEYGNPKFQSMQPSSPEVMANIIAELQSLRIRLAVLESK